MANRPTPSALRKISGSHPERISKREAVFQRADGVKVPKRVAADPYAQKHWDEIVPELVANGLLTRANQSLCADMCMAHAMVQKALDDIDENGQLIDEPIINKKGELTGATKHKSNPAVLQVAQYMAMKCRLMIEFGMTPASAAKVAASPEPERKENFDFVPVSDEEEETSDQSGVN